MAKKLYLAKKDRIVNGKRYTTGKKYKFDENYYKNAGFRWLEPVAEEKKEKEDKSYKDKEMK